MTQEFTTDAAVELLERAGYAIQVESFGTGRPDRPTLALRTTSGRPAIAKLYSAGGAAVAYRNMRSLWECSFGERRAPPGLPKPLDCLGAGSVLVMERRKGRPMAEINPIGDGPMLEDAIGVLVDLHNSDVRPDTSRSAKHILRSVRRKAARISELLPQYGESVGRVVAAMENLKWDDSELVPCHGDFSPRNVLVSSDSMVLIDWDRLQWADPARDVVYMGVWSWAWAIRGGYPSSWSTLNRALACYKAARPQARLDRQVPFHVAAGLVRIAHSLAELWRDEANLIPRLANEALERLR